MPRQIPSPISLQSPPSEPTCEFSEVCWRDALEGHDGKCILHSEDPEKNEEAFEEAFEEHREERDGDFRHMVFPSKTDFSRIIFESEADFSFATFKKANFSEATFNCRTSFSQAFASGENIRFDEADFFECEFGDDVLFAGVSKSNRAFAGGEVDFRDVMVASDVELHFRYADLSRCQLLRTDLRDAEFTGVKWCDDFAVGEWFSLDWFREKEWFNRVGLYDEVEEDCKRRSLFDVVHTTLGRMGSSDGMRWPLFEGEDDPEEEEPEQWREVERLYRQLKRNYEERGDFPGGGDFR